MPLYIFIGRFLRCLLLLIDPTNAKHYDLDKYSHHRASLARMNVLVISNSPELRDSSKLSHAEEANSPRSSVG